MEKFRSSFWLFSGSSQVTGIPMGLSEEQQTRLARAQLGGFVWGQVNSFSKKICILASWNPNAPCFGWKRPCFGGLTFKNRGHWGSRLVLVSIYVDESFFLLLLCPNTQDDSGKWRLTEQGSCSHQKIHTVILGFYQRWAFVRWVF